MWFGEPNQAVACFSKFLTVSGIIGAVCSSGDGCDHQMTNYVSACVIERERIRERGREGEEDYSV